LYVGENMKKAKIPLSRKGRKVIKITIILLIVLVGEFGTNKKTYASFTNEVDYTELLVKLDSYKKQTVQKVSTKKKTTKKKVTKTKTIKNSKGKSIVSYALKFNGNPYVHGGTSLTNGADCSGFTQSIYKHYGKSLPRTVLAQSKVGTRVSFSNLQLGDLVFYSNGGRKPTHVAIYIGKGKIIHASNPKSGIKISPVNIMKKIVARRIKL